MRRSKLSFLKARLLFGAAFVVLSVGHAYAQATDLAMPSQALSESLTDLSQRTGKNILFEPDIVAGIRAHALKGRMTVQEAAESLLQGTGLLLRSDGKGGLLIQKESYIAPIPPQPRYTQVAQASPPEPVASSAPANSTETVIVTSTRIQTAGFDAPTPTTVFGSRDIENSGEATVFAAVNQLPSLATSNSTQTFSTTQSSGTGGISSLNLRGLGSNRTLTLLDGQRVVGALTTGVTDAGAFPQSLVKRVDLVTGGASASWGSDAVAGVVNYVLDHDFTGFKANLNSGITTYDDDAQADLSVTAGTGFLGDRAHIEASVDITHSDGVPKGIGGRQWYDATRIVQYSIAGTPAGQPEYVVAPHVVSYQLAPGGIITAGPLQGTAFGPGGQPYAFQYGTIMANGLMEGGTQISDYGNNSNLDSTLGRATFYARASYNLTPDINAYATVNYGSVRTSAHSWPGEFRPAGLTIQCDNAFLPASVSAACAANNITSFQFGTDSADMPDNVAINTRTMKRVTVGVDGSTDLFGETWTWSGYAAHGENYDHSHITNDALSGLFNAAIDAVKSPNGQIVCRSAVAQAEGCVPLDVIGTGVGSPAAYSWVTGGAVPFLQTRLRQDVASFNVNGTPFSTWAGSVSVASGVEYRGEAFHQSADVYSNGNGGNPLLSSAGTNWFAGNFHPSHGNYDVTEGFLELGVPLLKSADFGDVDLDLAGRAEDYSTAGYVNTWKVGTTWKTPLEGLKLRALQSRDIRAPALSELFQAPQSNTGSVVDEIGRYAGQTVNGIQTPTLSNLRLLPEKGSTTELGIVYQPEWLPGFSGSIDYYRIDLKGAIAAVGAQQEVNLCALGNSAACNAIIRDPNSGQITQVNQTPINLSSILTDGFDLEAGYAIDASDIMSDLDGSFSMRALATHVSKYITNSGLPAAIPAELSGALYFGGDIPTWRLYATQLYTNNRWSFSLTERWIASGVNMRNWIQCTSACPLPTLNNPTVNNNQVSGALYEDVGGSIKITSPASDFQSEIYFKVDNLANVDPPKVAYSNATPAGYRATNPYLFDTLGRFFHLGIRVSTD